MRMKAANVMLFFLGFHVTTNAQDTTSKSRSLDSVIIFSFLNQNIIRQLPAVQGTYIFGGKKTEVIDLAQIPADMANKTGRQVFSKIPGIFDMNASFRFSKSLETRINVMEESITRAKENGARILKFMTLF